MAIFRIPPFAKIGPSGARGRRVDTACPPQLERLEDRTTMSAGSGAGPGAAMVHKWVEFGQISVPAPVVLDLEELATSGLDPANFANPNGIVSVGLVHPPTPEN